MFSCEDGASEILDLAIEKYESHFGQPFPTFEFLNITSNDHYDFSIEGCKRLVKFVDERIKKNSLVNIPDDYFERLY